MTALGQMACRQDYSVLYKRLPRIFAELELGRADERPADGGDGAHGAYRLQCRNEIEQLVKQYPLRMWVKLWVKSQEYKNIDILQMVIKNSGGGRGIRTLGRVTPTTVFETVPFNHSGTPPQGILA